MKENLLGFRTLIVGCSLFVVALLANSLWRQTQAPNEEAAQATWTITGFKATIGEGLATVLERPDYLIYRTPYFTADATLTVSTPKNQSYTIGFIQQVDSVNIRCDYAKAFTTWEIPKLPISDARPNLAPWYDSDEGRKNVKAGEKNVTVTLAMNDNFSPRVSWKEPLPPDGRAERAVPELRLIKRDQTFSVWLVAMRDSDKAISVLKKVSWRMEVDIVVDSTREIGSRCKVNKVPIHKPSIVDGSAEKVPEQCLGEPTANGAQEFWWNPQPGESGKRIQLNRHE
jgi:hypothetical protein